MPDFSFSDAHFVAEYASLSLIEVYQLDIYTYRMLLINAFVHQASQSEEGRKMVNRFNQLYNEDSGSMDVSGLKSLL